MAGNDIFESSSAGSRRSVNALTSWKVMMMVANCFELRI